MGIKRSPAGNLKDGGGYVGRLFGDGLWYQRGKLHLKVNPIIRPKLLLSRTKFVIIWYTNEAVD